MTILYDPNYIFMIFLAKMDQILYPYAEKVSAVKNRGLAPMPSSAQPRERWNCQNQ